MEAFPDPVMRRGDELCNRASPRFYNGVWKEAYPLGAVLPVVRITSEGWYQK
jgi:hypothetical protein